MNFYKKGDKVMLGKQPGLYEVLQDTNAEFSGKTQISEWGHVYTTDLKLVESGEKFKKGDLVKLGVIEGEGFFCAEDSDHYDLGYTMVNGMGHMETSLLSRFKGPELKKGEMVSVEGYVGSYLVVGDSNEKEEGMTEVSYVGLAPTDSIKKCEEEKPKTNNSQIIRKALITYARSFDMENADLRHVYDVLKELEGIGWE